MGIKSTFPARIKKKNPGREISRMGMIPKALAAVGKLGKKGQEIGREEREKLGEMGEKLGKKGGGERGETALPESFGIPSWKRNFGKRLEAFPPFPTLVVLP